MIMSYSVFATKKSNQEKFCLGIDDYVIEKGWPIDTFNDMNQLESYQNELQEDFEKTSNRMSNLAAYSPNGIEDMERVCLEFHSLKDKMRDISVWIAFATMMFKLIDEGWEITLE